MGISFDCPLHKNHRITIFFTNPLDGKPPENGAPLWQRFGESFETLTVSPPLDIARSDCWCGFITSGEVT